MVAISLLDIMNLIICNHNDANSFYCIKSCQLKGVMIMRTSCDIRMFHSLDSLIPAHKGAVILDADFISQVQINTTFFATRQTVPISNRDCCLWIISKRRKISL